MIMKRQGPILLLIVTLLFSGCLWARSDNGKTTVELTGTFAGHQELLLTSSGRTYLVDLGEKTAIVLSLEGGLWWIQAFSRDADGKVISASEPSQVQGGRQAVVSARLTKTALSTSTVKARNVDHTWLLEGGVELRWDSEGSTGNWEVWKRHSDSLFWKKVAGDLPIAEQTYRDHDPKAHEHLYAVRHVAPLKDGVLVLPSRLVASQGPRVGVLDVSWVIDHYFAPVSYSRLVSPMRLGGDPYPEPAYTDLVAHFRTDQDFAQRGQLLRALGLQIKRELPELLAVLVEPGMESEWSLEKWSTYEDAHLFIEPNWIVQANSWGLGADTPWYLDYLRIPAAHEETTGSQDVRIAVLDSGLNESQLPDTVRVLPGYNFTDPKNPNDTRDNYVGVYHGTNVARTISEAMPVVSIQPVKVLNGSGRGTDVEVSEGMLFAAGLHDKNSTPCDIINMSLGQRTESTLMRKRIEYITAQRPDILIIAASGNSVGGAVSPGIFYPAAFPQVVAVGAISPGPYGPERAYYSHFGQGLDVVAPPSFTEGTSFATALVSGVAGLMLARGVHPWDIRSVLAQSAMDLGVRGWDEEHGYGMVHAEWAVKQITELSLTVSNADGESARVEVSLNGTSRRFYVHPGAYSVEAWVNVRGGANPEPQDYVGQTGPLSVGEHKTVDVALTLSEQGF